jgi:hypothetical protein
MPVAGLGPGRRDARIECSDKISVVLERIGSGGPLLATRAADAIRDLDPLSLL